MGDMKETEIAGAVMDWLQAQGWDCYPEVCPYYGGARADIVGVRGGLVLICEVKTNMSLALLSQAIGWRGDAHFICIATPEKRRRGGHTRAENHLIQYFGLGHIEVAARAWRPENRVSERVEPRYRRPYQSMVKGLLDCLHPDMKRYAPGARAGYSTPWKRTMDRAVKFIEKHPGCTIRELFEGVSTHYASGATARACLRHWLPEDSRVRADVETKPFRYYPSEASG